MSITVNFTSFSKRPNSTARPSGGRAFTVVLKSPSGVTNPEIELAYSGNPSEWNYAHIPSFGRYYFVTEWTYSNGVWIAQLSVDVLASWKTYIGQSSQYILRCSAEFNGDVLDTLYPTKADIVNHSTNSGFRWATSLTSGRYVVGIINGDSGGVGAVKYYVFTQAQFNSLCSFLLSDISWLDLDFTEISEGLSKTLFNPFQYIASVMWFPFAVPTGGSANIKFGWWDTSVSASHLPDRPLYSITATFALRDHPQKEERGNYMNLNPYTRRTLEFRPFGSIPIDTMSIISSTTITAHIQVDLISGGGTMVVSPDGSELHAFIMTHAQVGVPIQLAQIGRDYLATAVNALNPGADIIGGVISGAKKGGPAGAVTGALTSIASNASGIESTIKSAMPQLCTTGGNGSISDYFFPPTLHSQFLIAVDDSNANLGRPLCEERAISAIPGYILVHNADISAPCTSTETGMIKSWMEAGFFYE